MIEIVIPYDPVPWTAPRIYKNHAYDPKEKEKRSIRYLIKQQYEKPPVQGYVSIVFNFVYSIPKSTSKKKKEKMLSGEIIPTRSDCTNCQKLYEDCLKNTVITDDRNVELIFSTKSYAEKGYVKIRVMTREEIQSYLGSNENFN